MLVSGWWDGGDQEKNNHRRKRAWKLDFEGGGAIKQPTIIEIEHACSISAPVRW